MAEEPLVLFMPSGRRGHFAVGTPLLEAARVLGVDVDSVCGGRGICGRCQVTVAEGEFPKHGISSGAENLSALSEPERRYTQKRTLIEGRRLSCHTLIHGNLVIDVPAESQIHRQIVRKDAEDHDITLNTLTRLCYVEVAPATMEEAASDLFRLQQALAVEWGLENPAVSPTVLTNLQSVVRKEEGRVTVAVHAQHGIIAAWPGFTDRAYGVAIDIGSTTISAHLCDLVSGEVVNAEGVMNPQIRFGEDLMSRVSYIQMHPGSEHDLTASVRAAIKSLVDVFGEMVDTDHILEYTIVANPIMHHLFLGINPVQLGEAPFPLVIDTSVERAAAAFDIGGNPGARLYALPCIAGHVGADTAGVLLATSPEENEEICLIVDIGTNAEIVIGNRDRLLAASSPTGPALEGAQLSSGQRASTGAIERVRIDPLTLEPRFRVIGSDLWSDEPGFEASVAQFGVTGICGSGVVEIIAELFLQGVLQQDGLFAPGASERSARVIEQGRILAYVVRDGARPIMITQQDVRAVQLAKAALYAGVKLLMQSLGVERVDRIRIAGAFGSHIDKQYAMLLGLIPDCPLEAVSSAGNAAGTGARIALLDRTSRPRVEALARRIIKVETALAPEFQDLFVGAMAFPHATDAFPSLNGIFKLPERQAAIGGRRRRR